MKRAAMVLAGGHSTRMGADKASLDFRGESLLGRVVRKLLDVVPDVAVIAREGQALPDLPEGVRVIPDSISDMGPMAGLLTGLRAFYHHDAVFATSCDAPLLRRGVVEHLFECLGDNRIAVAEAEGYQHPLCAVYSPRVGHAIGNLLQADERRPRLLFDEEPTRHVSELELRFVDPELVSLQNCNTPEALEAARAMDVLPEVKVELYEMARHVGGHAHRWIAASTLRDVWAELARRLPGLEPDVIRGNALVPPWVVSLDGKAFIRDPNLPLEDGQSLVVVSSLAGG